MDSAGAATGRSNALYGLRFGGRVDPLGVPLGPTRLSWSVDPDAAVDPDRGFRISAAPDESSLRDATWVAHSSRPWIVYDPAALTGSRGRACWRVEAFSGDGTVISSHPSTWEVGLAQNGDWSAAWVAAEPFPFGREGHDPCPHLRREFEVEDGWERARLYVTALGLYRVWLNGVELTSGSQFRPGWTDYDIRVYHQTLDCGLAVRRGTNVLAVKLAKGWFAGRLGLLREPGLWGTHPALRAQLELDGRIVVGTDRSWLSGYGTEQVSELLRGEVRDLRQEPAGWQEVGFDDSTWRPVRTLSLSQPLISPQPHDGIAVHAIHPGMLVHEHARGPAVFDFGQNLVGWTRLSTRCLPTVDLIVRHGEILTPEKGVYRDNLRGAFQEDTYIVPDAGPHTLASSFTMHGFRYAEVWGLPSQEPHGSLRLLQDTTIEAISVSGLGEAVGRFTCSNTDLDRLARNIEWTVRDNFLEVVTDCPQRDERQGWLGDAGIIAPTAAYLFDISAFLGKFTQDIVDAQGPDGQIRDYAPALPSAKSRPGAPGWSDGFIRLMHLLVERYGDLVTADRHFGAMARFLDHVDRANPDGIRVNAVGADFGDWLSLPEDGSAQYHTGYSYTGAYSTTPHAIVDTAHSYRSFVQLAEIAARLGRDGDASALADRAEAIRRAYVEAFVQPAGTIAGATQTAYAQAVGFGLLTGQAAQIAADNLRSLIERVGYVTTGIHGVGHVLPVLTAHGHADFAMSLLLREAMPSWLYMIRRDATTIWEKWDGIRPDGTLSTAEMNSFNHCALGAVGQYLFESLAGVDATRTAWTGELVVAAHYARRLDWVDASYEGPTGRIASAWRRRADGEIEHSLEIPGASTARYVVPAGDHAQLDGVPAPGATELRIGPGRHVVRLRSGSRR